MRLLFNIGCVAIFSVSPAVAQDRASELTKTQEILAIAKTTVAEIQGKVDGSDDSLEAKGPIYTFSDPSRSIVSGTLWVWGKEGRPAAIMSLCTISERRYYEFRSFSDRRLKFQVLGREWAPQPSWDPVKIENAPAPATSKPRRLSQMKELVARFRCEVVEPEKGRTELRILPTPIYRYEDPKKALDGCVFAMCRDGDPEAILILESTESSWQFMGGTMTSYTPTLYLDEKPYKLEERTSPKMSYIFHTRPALANEK